MALLEGKIVAAAQEEKLRAQIRELSVQPGLAVILAGEDGPSKIYVRRKQEACERVGMHSEMVLLPGDVSETMLLSEVERLNQDPKIHGILVQLPLPPQIDAKRVLEAIAPEKDVDGFHPLNAGYLLTGTPKQVPCTPLGILHLLKHYEIPLAGKQALVIGRSNIVGKPMALLLLQENATVTLAHSRTQNLSELTQKADIIVAAVGQAQLVTGEMVKDGVVVVDVGMNRMDGKLCGDVDFDSVAPKAAWITPVPGGVGPMTIATLLYNTVKAAQENQA
ncbi:bifunctional methylenetetrahydrofolate dehydrogenase/methenyltetrahydrofolate cyclohydrolase FolD [bacterium (Candidatus Blackallbacteria) CG13_big_fil_rev_8_21_14_2_50_49_14]|nr:MAG: bifunctional methylenetetrahydrofolate dehydrogenase/methenyltetrahydrofolate cyclohydrolase FolD [bacterium (Candidatus Blackallbacteria) CG18_big_fil_WC_8_21_14_2_50_49_26]PIW48708.1 MAG: bifunctional methylenetetrahydrofolate dehydrogenase/methenyltetrahydrofolate cyclohydrolase FolD [bacterium (Candidatus Blackallbacteria) CG13_big_fil_rev_8_21_14_2_50_49_14]